MATMYEIGEGYALVLAQLEETSDPEEQESLWEQMDALDANLADKADVYAKIMKMKQGEIAMLKAESTRLAKLAAAAEETVQQLKDRLLETMKTAGYPKIETSIGKWYTQKNPPCCEILRDESVPSEYHIPQPDKIDRAAIIHLWKETGKQVEGANVTQETGIRFR